MALKPAAPRVAVEPVEPGDPPRVARGLLPRRLLGLALAGLLPFLEASAAERLELFNGRNLDGWHTWLVDTQRTDPRRVFTVTNGCLRISGVRMAEPPPAHPGERGPGQ